MNAEQPLPTPPASPHLPPLARTFLAARLVDQSTSLENLQTSLASLRHKHDNLVAQNPSVNAQTSMLDMRSFTRAANAENTAELDRIGRDFETEVGNANEGWIKREVVERVRQGCGRVLLVRVEIAQLEHLCAQFETTAALGVGASRADGLDAFGEVFERGEHPHDVDDDDGEEWPELGYYFGVGHEGGGG